MCVCGRGVGGAGKEHWLSKDIKVDGNKTGNTIPTLNDELMVLEMV